MPRRKKTRTSQRSAFTLLELLVVISIMSVLGALLFASLGPIMHSTRMTICLNNMRLLGNATLAYAGDHNGSFPIQENSAWDIPLSHYLDVTAPDNAIAILKCPEDVRPLKIAPGRFARSYCFNFLLPEKVSAIVMPAQTIMMAEWYTGVGGPPGGASENFQYGGNYNVVEYTAGGIPSNKNMVGYHQAFSNFLFADAHVKSVDPRKTVGTKSLWTISR